MKRNPRFWTRARLDELSFLHTNLGMDYDVLALHFGKTERAIEMQLSRLNHMHETTGTGLGAWYGSESI